jgi:hypothetical protein
MKPLHLTLVLKDDFKKLLNIRAWGEKEVSWKDILKLKDNDKVNDLLYTSKHF